MVFIVSSAIRNNGVEGMKCNTSISVLIVFVVFVSGCILNQKPTCNKPYILIGNDCCMDEDNDGICDKDKPITSPSTSSTTSTTTSTSSSSTSLIMDSCMNVCKIKYNQIGKCLENGGDCRGPRGNFERDGNQFCKKESKRYDTCCCIKEVSSIVTSTVPSDTTSIRITTVYPSTEISASNLDDNTIGVSYNQMMNYLSNSFTMEKSTPVKGRDRYMGTTSSGTTILEIIGEKDNIAQTTLIIGIPSDNQYILIENSAILLRFLENAVPEWEDSSDWVTTSIEKFSSSTSNKEEKVYGNKLIEMSLLKELGWVMVTVKHK